MDMNKKLLMVLLIGLLFRFYSLGVIPYWHWDEGVNMNLSWNIIHGKALLFTLRYPFVPHPPLFYLIVGALLKLFGNELIVLRLFCAVLSSLTILVLYLVGKELGGVKLGLFASFLFAIYPDAIYWGRMGFANNLIMLLGLMALYLFLRDRVYLSCLCVGLASATGIIGASLIPAIIFLLLNRKRKLMYGTIIMVTPLILYTILMLALTPDAFIHDWIFLVNRLGINKHNIAGLMMILSVAIFRERVKKMIRKSWKIFERDLRFTFGHHLDFFKNDCPVIFLLVANISAAIIFTMTPLDDNILFNGTGYFLMGFIGLLFVKRRGVVLSFFIPISIVVMLTGRTDHMIIPLHPYFPLGLGALILWFFKKIPVRASLMIVLLCYPFGFALYRDTSAFILGRGLERENIEELHELVGFINNNTLPEDIVITNSHILRFLNSKSSILTQSIAIDGTNVSYYPGNIEDRFVHNYSFRNAKYLVLEKGVTDWLDNISVEHIAREIEKWPSVFETEEFFIRRNPSYNKTAEED